MWVEAPEQKPAWTQAGVFEAIIASTKGFSKDTDLLLGIGEEEIKGLIEQHGGGVRLFERRAEEKVEEATMGEGVERDREEGKALIGRRSPDWQSICSSKHNANANANANALPIKAEEKKTKRRLFRYQIKRRLLGMFKHILYWVTARTPNLRVMVQHLLLHNGYKDLTFTNDSQAANCLRKLLEELKGNGGILLVFDDVFAGAESLLKTFQINLQDYKILVTSQFEFPSFGPTYHLKPLEHRDAKNLLIQLASPLPHHTNPDVFEDLLQKTLKRCYGLPLVIEVVGVSLKGRGLHLWKDQVESWSEGKIILERLQPSFNALEPHLKECFMDMGSFLEDHKIRASVIIDLWVELYGTSSSSSIVYMKYLNDLASQNLLKLVPLRRNEQEDGFYIGS
uniref:Uncharacterized protein n=1 Tax=Brassica oleracea var. oleracea TaxID=109376 RepID=A0A0D3AXB8_BRAOL